MTPILLEQTDLNANYDVYYCKVRREGGREGGKEGGREGGKEGGRANET
jgi:hypothetical protein